MPALSFLAVVGLALIALLFTNQYYSLLEAQAVQTLTTAQAPAPDMTSQAVLAAQPKSAAPDALAKIGHVACAARAEAPHKDRRVTQFVGQQTPLFDRYSIKGY